MNVKLIFFIIILYFFFRNTKENFRQVIVKNDWSAIQLTSYYETYIGPLHEQLKNVKQYSNEYENIWQQLMDIYAKVGFVDRGDDLFKTQTRYLDVIKERTKEQVKQIIEKKPCSGISCYSLQTNRDIPCSSNQCLKQRQESGGGNVVYNNITKENCSNLCNGSTNCKGFVHYTKEKKCWLLSGTSNPVVKSNSNLYVKIEETNLPPYSQDEIKKAEPKLVFVNDKLKFMANDYVYYYEKNIEPYQTPELLKNPENYQNLYDRLISNYEYLGVKNNSDDVNSLKRGLERIITNQLQNDLEFVKSQNLQREMIMTNLTWFNAQDQKNYWIQNPDQVAAARAIQRIQDIEKELYQAKLKRGKDPGAFINFWKSIGAVFQGVFENTLNTFINVVTLTTSVVASLTTGKGISSPLDFFKKVGCLGLVIKTTDPASFVFKGRGPEISLISGLTGLDESKVQISLDAEGALTDTLSEQLC
jgi:hypothetical protein